MASLWKNTHWGTFTGRSCDSTMCATRELPRWVFRLSEGEEIPKTSGLRTLNLFIDQDELLRLGGRLTHASIEQREKHSIIIPGKIHLALLITKHFHKCVRHQGHLFTEGAIRNAGFWIIWAKKRIHSVIHKCIICQKLRGRVIEQKNGRSSTRSACHWSTVHLCRPWHLWALDGHLLRWLGKL